MNQTQKEELKKKLLAIAKNEIRLSWKQKKEPLSATSSRIGGKPAVPRDFEWPYFEGDNLADGKVSNRPLAFMAQVNLKDVAELDKDGVLPKTGMLSFFYGYTAQAWGIEPDDKGSARVFYFPDESQLSVRDYPEDMLDDDKFPELSTSFESKISVPNDEAPELKIDVDDWDAFEAVREECGADEEEDYTKLLGYPNVIQNPMEDECECMFRSLKGEDVDPDDEEVREHAKDWTLLFQMGTIDEIDIMFGDCGYIYFWIRKEDLRNLNFDDIWTIQQCY